MEYTENYQFRKPTKALDIVKVGDINFNSEKIDELIHSTQISLAPAYDEHSTAENPYNTGDIVMHDALMYKCKADGVYGAWDATKWERTTAGEEGGGGGGGNADLVELTQAEYDELTPEEQMNGKMYFIIDGQGEGDAYFYPIIYSTEERCVGVWVDNKPLYAKTIELSSEATISYNSWTSLGILVNTLDIETYVNCNAINSVGVVWNDVDAGTFNGYICLCTGRNGDTITAKYVNLWYTKTTDVAGSGKYNTLGVPTVHYSTDEQVIGTWIDGKPLYQKTVVITSLPSNTSVTQQYPHNIDSIGEIVNHDVIATWQSGSTVKLPYAQLTSGQLNSIGSIDCNINKTNIEIRVGTDRSNMTAYATIQYTKITD